MASLPYFDMHDEMSIQDGLIFKGERVVVPGVSRSELLKRIHNSHLGVNGCLSRVRDWFSGQGWQRRSRIMCLLAKHVESMKETMISPETPSRPWQRVAADLFELEGKGYLVTSDYCNSSVGVIRVF